MARLARGTGWLAAGLVDGGWDGGGMGRFHGRPADYAMKKLAFFLCSRCQKPYFSGAVQCQEVGVARREGGRSVVVVGRAGLAGVPRPHAHGGVPVPVREAGKRALRCAPPGEPAFHGGLPGGER